MKVIEIFKIFPIINLFNVQRSSGSVRYVFVIPHMRVTYTSPSHSVCVFITMFDYEVAHHSVSFSLVSVPVTLSIITFTFSLPADNLPFTSYSTLHM
jgi:hypothetical protein